MKRTLLLTCVVIIVAYSSNVYSQSNAEYKTKIESINKQMAKDMIAGNNEKNLSLYTDDAVSMPSYGPLQDGIAAIRKANADMAKSGMKFNSFETTILKVLPGGNLITEIGTYKMNMSMQGMDKPMDDHGKYVTVWEKQKDGSLKVKVEIWNSDVDPTQMMKDMQQSGGNK